MEESPQNTAIEPRPPRLLAVEVGVVLCLGYVPYLASALLIEHDAITFVDDMTLMVLYSLQVVAPLLYIMSRSEGGWAEFGITKFEPLTDGGLSIVLFALVWTLCNWIIGITAPPTPVDEAAGVATGPSGAAETVLLLVALTFNSLSEEFVMRAYLITRFQQLGMHVTTAVVVSTILFASYHIYQGYWVLTPIAVMGLIYGAAFAITHRVWPLVIAHTVYNILVYTMP